MAEELTYRDEAAAGHDRAFARVTTHFIPLPLRAARIATGMRVLDARKAVREEVRRDLGDTGGPIEAEVEYRLASGRCQQSLEAGSGSGS